MRGWTISLAQTPATYTYLTMAEDERGEPMSEHMTLAIKNMRRVQQLLIKSNNSILIVFENRLSFILAGHWFILHSIIVSFSMLQVRGTYFLFMRGTVGSSLWCEGRKDGTWVEMVWLRGILRLRWCRSARLRSSKKSRMRTVSQGLGGLCCRGGASKV